MIFFIKAAVVTSLLLSEIYPPLPIKTDESFVAFD